MNDTRTAIPMGLKHILDAIYADPEVHLPELMDWVDRMYPEAGPSGSVTYALLKQACSDRTGGLYRWLGSLFREIDAQTLYHLSENYILHADWTRHHAAAAADSRTVTCLVDTEERERGIHRFLIAGDEPLQHKRELVAVANKHSRCTFWVLTGGKLIDERFARDLLRTGNVIPLLTREKLDGTPAQASEILHTFRVLFGMLVSGSEPAADQDRAIEQGAKEVLLITDPYALGYGTPPQDRTIGQSMGDTPDLTLPVRLWRLKRENGRDARWMLDDARHLVIDSLGIAGIVNDSGEGSGFAHILRLREVAPA